MSNGRAKQCSWRAEHEQWAIVDVAVIQAFFCRYIKQRLEHCPPKFNVYYQCYLWNINKIIRRLCFKWIRIFSNWMVLWTWFCVLIYHNIIFFYNFLEIAQHSTENEQYSGIDEAMKMVWFSFSTSRAWAKSFDDD